MMPCTASASVGSWECALRRRSAPVLAEFAKPDGEDGLRLEALRAVRLDGLGHGAGAFDAGDQRRRAIHDEHGVGAVVLEDADIAAP